MPRRRLGSTRYSSGGYYYPRFREYVPVSARRAQAGRAARKMAKAGRALRPIAIEGRTIARTFWGSAWCSNLESYSDYVNRLPRGRTYVRNGSVIDLAVSAGKVEALVQGSELYQVEIQVGPAKPSRWKAIVQECGTGVGSMVELLQGRFSSAVMQVMSRAGDGLFPTPREIAMTCSCPDWATMCKHVAAVLYGVGARLDESPELLFALRAVDPADLIDHAAKGAVLAKGASVASERRLSGDQLGAVFGIDLDSTPAPPEPSERKPRRKETRSVAPGAPSPGEPAQASRALRGPAHPKKRATRSSDPDAALRQLVRRILGRTRHPLSSELLRADTGADPLTYRRVIAGLLTEGLVERSGAKRGTCYRWIGARARV